jgi:hypothetical protein
MTEQVDAFKVVLGNEVRYVHCHRRVRVRLGVWRMSVIPHVLLGSAALNSV